MRTLRLLLLAIAAVLVPLRTTAQQAEADAPALEARVDALESDVRSLQTDAGSTRSDLSRLSSDVSRLESAIDDASTGVVLFLCGVFCALWAQNTRRSPWLWFFLGLFFHVITLLVLLAKNAGDRRNGDPRVPAMDRPRHLA